MSTQLEQVKILLRTLRTDEDDYRQLHKLLINQRMCMIRRSSEGLAEVNATIEQCYQKLSDSTRLRRDTLTALGVTADKKGMEQVFSWLPAAHKKAAQSLWQELERRAESCKTCNEKNGELLTRQYEFVQAFLGNEPSFIYQRQF
ncbi:flagellar protein FlgN [Enterobacteriaceae bacterium H16N7]|nr:flagellar protein FlgN [Dryocola clanedunensis]